MTAWNTPAPDFTAGLDAGVRGLRVALSPRLGQRCAARSRDRSGGAQGGARAGRAGRHRRGGRSAARAHARHDPGDVVAGDDRAWSMRCRRSGAREMDPGLLRDRRTRPTLHGRRLSRRLYARAPNCTRRCCASTSATIAADADACRSPRSKVGLETPEDGGFGDDWIDWSPYTYPFNLTQQPAASVPCGLARNGLPMGVQIVGRAAAPTPACCGRRGRSNRRCRCRGRRASADRNFLVKLMP